MLVERLARHLAPQPDRWRDHVEAAVNILALMKLPDAAMRAAGDAVVWERMIDAALRARPVIPQDDGPIEAPRGSDEEGEVSMTPDAVGHDRADWVHVNDGKETGS